MAERYHNVTWPALRRDALALAARLEARGPWRGLVAVSRGGLIPAALVAQALDIRLIETLGIASYAGEARGEARLLKAPLAAGDGEGFAVIDDLVDSGATAALVRALLPRACFATLYAKPQGAALADLFVAAVSQETWIVFPWDTPPEQPPF